MDDQTRRLILDNVLCCLDDLYDEKANVLVNLWRLLTASSVALKGDWVAPMQDAAAQIHLLLGEDRDTVEANRIALAYTDDLRLMIANAPS